MGPIGPQTYYASLSRVTALLRGQPSAGRDSSWEPGPPGDYLANRLGDEAPTG